MAHRKNTKRIDPRYFLHETVKRGEETLEEGFEHPKSASGHASPSKAGSWNRKDIANKAVGRWLKESDDETLDEDQAIFAPNHYCVHHGGVQHEGQIKMAEAINHNYDRELNRVTHYDMRLQNGTILEGVATEDIQVVRASLAEEHSHGGGCPPEEVGAADISQLTPEEAFEAGMAAARDAIDQVMGAPDGPPPEGELQ